MKKYFFFAAAAIAMLASCNKSGLDDQTPADNDSPVAIELGVNVPSIATVTKAAVDEWAGNKVYVYGLRQERTANGVNAFGAGMYDFSYANNIVGYDVEAAATADNSKKSVLNLYKNKANKTPYYYEDGQTYDFFGYHLGNATQGEVTSANDVVSFPVTINGNDDVMYAYTDKANDLLTFQPKNSEVGTVADLYSSWAVRRNVKPTLVFTHGLTRFNFIVRGAGDSYATVQIQKIEASTVKEGTLTVVGKLPQEGIAADASTIGYVPSATAEAALVELKDAADAVIPATFVTANAEKVPYGGDGASLMVAPGMAELPVVVTMKNKVSDAVTGDDGEQTAPEVWSDAYTYTFDALATQVVKDGAPAGITTFAAGTAYNIYINVYGPEEIIITAELTDWVPGGEYTYDPDDAFRPGTVTPDDPAAQTVVVPAETVTVIDGTDEEAFNTFFENKIAYDPDNTTYPWFGFKVASAEVDRTFAVKCFNNGAPVKFNAPLGQPDWFVTSEENTVATFTMEAGKTIVSFEIGEVAIDPDAEGNYDLSGVSFEYTVVE